MTLGPGLVGRSYPPTAPYTVTVEKVRELAGAVGAAYDGPDGPVEEIPPTFPIVLAFAAMNDFLAAEQVELARIVHGEQRFAYERPLAVGDVLTAELTIASLRQIGGNDIIGTRSAIHDATGALVCTATATLVHRAGEGA